MSQAGLTCPKCNSEMVRGCVMDRTQGCVTVSTWTTGTPKRSWWPLYGNGIKTPSASEQIPIGTFRCQSCGFLESYARQEFAPD